ncbi:hypothetical protein QMK17_09905 [Rhodococcus sp. G-MC3]|nr:hypothetical protein [Rhodococcus sp. G-MC3]MDJ0393643.1 hypothetical protein [Rhodococcus sp. G-MC3]
MTETTASEVVLVSAIYVELTKSTQENLSDFTAAELTRLKAK